MFKKLTRDMKIDKWKIFLMDPNQFSRNETKMYRMKNTLDGIRHYRRKD